MLIQLITLKAGLVLFWSIWLSVVFFTNLMDGLKKRGWLPDSWKWVSGNYKAVKDVLAGYDLPNWLAGLLFLGVLVWQGLALVLFWIAFQAFAQSGAAGLPQVNTAFSVLLALWAAFVVVDEIFRSYNNEQDHLILFIAQLATLLLIHLL